MMTFVCFYGFVIHAKFVKADASLHPIPIKSRVWTRSAADLNIIVYIVTILLVCFR